MLRNVCSVVQYFNNESWAFVNHLNKSLWQSLLCHILGPVYLATLGSIYCATLLAQFIVPHYWLSLSCHITGWFVPHWLSLLYIIVTVYCATLLAQFVVHYCFSLLCHIICCLLCRINGSVYCATLLVQFTWSIWWLSEISEVTILCVVYIQCSNASASVTGKQGAVLKHISGRNCSIYIFCYQEVDIIESIELSVK
jgi:hypothetical protein